jgi:hypothetical protein
MALSRWSYSDWYIYDAGDNEEGQPEICICTIGNFTVEDVNHWKGIESKVIADGYGYLSRIELRLYLTLWAKLESRKIERDAATFRINLLRLAGHIRYYVNYPNQDTLRTILRYLEKPIGYLESKLFPVYYNRKAVLKKQAVEEWLASHRSA